MEEELNVSEEYKTWFNRGYELSQSMPTVFDRMIIQGEGSEKSQAFDAGRKQFKIDRKRTMEKEKDEALLERFKAKRKSRNRGRGR